jgi:hypothetical protein
MHRNGLNYEIYQKEDWTDADILKHGDTGNAFRSGRFHEEIDGQHKAHRDDEAFHDLRGHRRAACSPV